MSWRQILRRTISTLCPRTMFLTRGPGQSGVCLTFDDGPHPVHTPRVLDVLGTHGVRATFFLVGREAARYPEVVQRIIDEGHDIGHHSYDHRPPELTSAAELVSEIGRTSAIFERVAGRPIRLVRPPHGKVTISKLWQLWRRGYTVVLWSVDPKDFACRSDEQLKGRLSQHEFRGGDVVLLHDNHQYAAEVLGDLIAGARARKLEFCRISQWAKNNDEHEFQKHSA